MRIPKLNTCKFTWDNSVRKNHISVLDIGNAELGFSGTIIGWGDLTGSSYAREDDRSVPSWARMDYIGLMIKLDPVRHKDIIEFLDVDTVWLHVIKSDMIDNGYVLVE